MPDAVRARPSPRLRQRRDAAAPTAERRLDRPLGGAETALARGDRRA